MTERSARDHTLTGAAGLVVAVSLAIVTIAGTGQAGVRVLVRATARSSALILCLALRVAAPFVRPAVAMEDLAA